MAMGTFFVCLAAAWVAQIYLAFKQAKEFMARVRAVRAHGKAAVGSAGNRYKGRAYVVMAIDEGDTVTAAESLRGATVFARSKPRPELVGRKAADLAAGRDLPELPARVRQAVVATAAMFHPGPGGIAHQLALPVPWYRRLLRQRGGAARA